MIIASGYNIYPIEVEDIIYQHPAVKETCVYGVPDSYRGGNGKSGHSFKERQVSHGAGNQGVFACSDLPDIKCREVLSSGSNCQNQLSGKYCAEF